MNITRTLVSIDSLIESRCHRRPLSAILWTLRPLLAFNFRRGNYCFRIDPWTVFLPFFFGVLNLLLRTPRSEGTNQARKHSRTICNRSCTEQRSTYSSVFVSTRQQRATTQASRRERVTCVVESHLYVRALHVSLFSSSVFVFYYLCVIKPPTIDFLPSTADTQPCDGTPSRRNTSWASQVRAKEVSWPCPDQHHVF